MEDRDTERIGEERARLQITRERDLPMLRWIGVFHTVSVEQVARYWFASHGRPGGYRAAARRVRKLEQAGYLVRDRVMHRSSTVLRLTPEGHKLVGLDLRPATLAPALVEHYLAVVDLAEALQSQHPDWQLMTEREFRQYRRTAMLTGERPPSTGRARLPDCVFFLPRGPEDRQQQWIAIELERSEKTPDRVRGIIASYYRDRPAEVWWYVACHAAQRYRELIRQEKADYFMTVKEWSST